MSKFQIVLKTLIKNKKELHALIDMCKRDIDIPKLVRPEHAQYIQKFLDTALEALNTQEIKDYIKEQELIEGTMQTHIVEIAVKSTASAEINKKFPLLNQD
jgi:hypothetical protein